MRVGEIHLRVSSLHQLFDPMDASPFARKDLQPRVEEFIVSWGRELPAHGTYSLIIHLDGSGSNDEASATTGAIRAFFEERALARRRDLRRLFRLGRISLLIALVVLVVSIVAGELLRATESPLVSAIGGTLEIGGWVAMWRPLEIFLYDWWPVRADIRLFNRFAAMEVRVLDA